MNENSRSEANGEPAEITRIWPAGKQIRQIVMFHVNPKQYSTWFDDAGLQSFIEQLKQQGVAVFRAATTSEPHISNVWDIIHDVEESDQTEIAYIPDTIYDRDDLLIGEETEPEVSSGEGVEPMSLEKAKEVFPGIEIVYDGS